MEHIVKGGRNVYGYDIGVLMLDSVFPRVCGDIGNAATWDFPVLYQKVKGVFPKKAVRELTDADIDPFIEAARQLEKNGVRAITTSCGFLVRFQEQLSSCVDIPVFTSALLFVPMLSKMIGSNKKIGILTADKKALTENHVRAAGIEDVPCRIVGLENRAEFTSFTIQNRNYVDTKECQKELVEAAGELMLDKNVSMIVLECTNMPPYTRDIQKVAGVPVFDIVMLTELFYRAFHQKRFTDL